MRNDVVYWLQKRALRRYGATMNAAHTETQEWLWADEITRLRKENERLREALKPFADELKEQKVEVPHVTEDERFIYSYTLRLKHLRAAAAAIREDGT